MSESSSIKQEYDDYVYAVSHDLGAPIRQVKAFLGLLFDDLDKGDMNDIEDYKNQCLSAIAQADLILDRLLDYSRLNAHEIDLQSQKIMDFLTENSRLKINVDPNVVATLDSKLFQIMVDELIDNALKFSEGNTEISYSDGSLIFKTHDVIIPTDRCDEIFKPLRTLHPKNTNIGCGMGLAIVKKCADMQSMQCHCTCDDNSVQFALKLP